MELRTINLLLALVTGRVWKGDEERLNMGFLKSKHFKKWNLWNDEEAIEFIKKYFVQDIMEDIPIGREEKSFPWYSGPGISYPNCRIIYKRD